MLSTAVNLKQDMQNSNKNESAEVIEISSRFGKISADLSKSIYFPKGIYGFPEDLHFVACNFNREDLQTFKILQCLDDHSVSLPVLPAAYENKFIDAEDMAQCLADLEIEKENFGMLFILTSSKNLDGSFEISVNTKAPIILDVSKKMAVQYIFNSNKYSTSHIISNEKAN